MALYIGGLERAFVWSDSTQLVSLGASSPSFNSKLLWEGLSIICINIIGVILDAMLI